MKKLILAIFLGIYSISAIAQGQSEELHDATIIGSFELGNKEVTTIYDETTGCERKTSPHSKNLFVPNETVQIKIKENAQMAEVIKATLPEQVFANKDCGNGQQNCLSSLCILRNDENNLILRYIENDLKVYFNAKGADNLVISNLIIYNGNNGFGSIPISHILDKSDPTDYKLTAYRGVLSESDKMKNRAGLSISNGEITLVENLLSNLRAQGNTIVRQELAKSIFYNIAILKTTKRALDNNSETCNCAPIPFYFKDDSPFICQEDLFYNVNEILNTLEENFTIISQEYSPETILSVQTFFENKEVAQVNEVSFEEAYINLSDGVSTNEFVTYLDELIDDPEAVGNCLLYGSDPGCCGNYSGCCWYADAACLYHDLACWCCGSWACFSGCVAADGCN